MARRRFPSQRRGGWSGGTGESLGAIPFGSATAEYFREKVQAPFFAHFLKDKGPRDFAEALTFEAGANEWRRWDQWPPVSRTDTRGLYFGPDEQLTLTKPTTRGFDEYVSDPAHPVPYRHRPIQPTYFRGGSKWSTWLVEDQRFVDDRADVLSWETAPLEYTWSLHTQNYTFKKGHRVMVQVQSTWFPSSIGIRRRRPEHLRGVGARLQGGDASHSSLAAVSVARRHSRRAIDDHVI